MRRKCSRTSVIQSNLVKRFMEVVGGVLVLTNSTEWLGDNGDIEQGNNFLSPLSNL